MGRALARRTARRARARSDVETLQWEDPRVKDYASFVYDRFETANAALFRTSADWPTKEDEPVWYEFQRQYADWRHWWENYTSFWVGWTPREYEEVKTFDVNLSRVLVKARDAGADVSGVAMGRHEDPLYKKEQKEEDEKKKKDDPVGQVVSVVKWGAIAVVLVTLGKAATK